MMRSSNVVVRVLVAVMTAVLIMQVIAQAQPVNVQAQVAAKLITVAEAARDRAVSLAFNLELLVNASSTLNLTININNTVLGLETVLSQVRELISQGDLYLSLAKEAYNASNYDLAKEYAVTAIKYYGQASKLVINTLKLIEESGIKHVVVSINVTVTRERMKIRNCTGCMNTSLYVAIEKALDLAKRLNFTLLVSEAVNETEVMENYLDLLAKLKELAEEAISLLEEGRINETAHLIGEMHRLIAFFINESVHSKLMPKCFKFKFKKWVNATGISNEVNATVDNIDELLSGPKGWDKVKDIFETLSQKAKEKMGGKGRPSRGKGASGKSGHHGHH